MRWRVSTREADVLLTACGLLSMLMSAQASDKSLRLSVHQQFGRALYRECQLEIGTYDGAGTASLRCVRNVTPASELLRRRSLTAEEVRRLVALARESDLFSGGHIGIDGTGSDGPPYETLRVSREAITGVLVTSGNPTFAAGPRGRLLDLLHTLLQELQDSAK